MRLFGKTGTEPGEEEIRPTIDELIETGVPTVAAHITGRERSPWSALLYVVIPLIAIAFHTSIGDVVSSSTVSEGSTSPNEGTATSAVMAENISFGTERLDLAGNARRNDPLR
jgi:hypothetical protein